MPDSLRDGPPHKRIVVLGAGGPVGREICRIGRSIGHDMLGVADGGRATAPDEPWTAGVDWLDAGPGDTRWEASLREADAAVWMWRDRDSLSRAAGAVGTRHDGGPGPSGRRIVVVGDHDLPAAVDDTAIAAARDTTSEGQPSSEAGSDTASTDLEFTILDSPPLHGADPSAHDAAPVTAAADTGDPVEPAAPSQPFEVLAIAALRSAVESDIADHLDPEAVTDLGRAVFLQ